MYALFNIWLAAVRGTIAEPVCKLLQLAGR
jgi:hypothetical protein